MKSSDEQCFLLPGQKDVVVSSSARADAQTKSAGVIQQGISLPRNLLGAGRLERRLEWQLLVAWVAFSPVAKPNVTVMGSNSTSKACENDDQCPSCSS